MPLRSQGAGVSPRGSVSEMSQSCHYFLNYFTPPRLLSSNSFVKMPPISFTSEKGIGLKIKSLGFYF